ncbi:hypothetical protein Clacol_008623 [Clathrus columnatus]|uniref:Saccharopine dehydrogenase n=1 Tax=Clathrus columnatus TaxID=1419009 RepID=A0AAV5AMK8_9AGAM|nr:hypothetical protein Clacol_008623 [Clathrus columnatus]
MSQHFKKSLTHRRLLKQHFTSKSNGVLTVGIRREDPTRLWERRCPLTPSAVQQLVQEEGVRVLVQHCNRRVFETREFEKAGATTDETLASAHIVLGIKEVPIPDLLHHSNPLPLSSNKNGRLITSVPRTHLMFSHTGKGQTYNMPLLAKFVKPGMDRLIDYEFLTDGPAPTGKRVVAFGWFAGGFMIAAGVIEGLCASAHDFLSFGVASPFLYLPRPYMCRSVEGMRQTLRQVGTFISEHGTPIATGPFVIALTGNGNVAKGALSLLNELPHTQVAVEDLPSLVSSPENYLVPSDGSSKPFNRSDYYSRPSDWKSIFHEKVAPYTTLLINGAGWQPGFPRLMTNEQLAFTRQESHRHSRYGRFRTIADVSCDVKGGLEFMNKSTTIDSPFYTAKPSTIPENRPGVQIMSVDILPTQIPEDSSKHFSNALMPYLRTIIRQYQGRVSENDRDYVQALNRATVAQNGELQGTFKWLYEPLSEHVRSSNGGSLEIPAVDDNKQVPEFSFLDTTPKTEGIKKTKNILLLGSGMVARPAIEEIAKHKDIRLLVASNNVSEVDFISKLDNVNSKHIDLVDLNSVKTLIDESDVVISLLPVPFHPTIAKLCIERKKHLVTASYISDDMRKLHQRGNVLMSFPCGSALESDVILLNEIGLDPGIDHCSAISLIERLKAQNKRIKSFISFCGGLPAPECAGTDVPLRYKFSWSPRGVLNAALNPASFKLRNKIYNIPGDGLLQSRFKDVPLSDKIPLEGIANRDSFPYVDFYSLGSVENMNTVLRGTLRYPGFSSLMDVFKRIGLLESRSSLEGIRSWSALASRSLARKYHLNTLKDNDEASFRSAIKDLVDLSEEQMSELMRALSWLGIAPSPSSYNTPTHNTIPFPTTKDMTPIDLFSNILSHRLKYQDRERDMVILAHEIIAVSENNSSPFEEVHTSTLTAYGTPVSGISAMARTVGLPVAFAALAIVNGRVAGTRGVCGPSMSEIYEPVLVGLEEAGIGFVEGVNLKPVSLNKKLAVV